jgi:hypothetical protein
MTFGYARAFCISVVFSSNGSSFHNPDVGYFRTDPENLKIFGMSSLLLSIG